MMTRDDFLTVAVVLAFATLVTSHVTIVAGLVGLRPRKRALLALFVAPLAPYWALRTGMRIRAAVWVASALAYATIRTIGTLG
jgi:hypothetical protein